MLKAKQPKHDDPRLQIPKTAPKKSDPFKLPSKPKPAEEPAEPQAEPPRKSKKKPTYGRAYEHERKGALKGRGESAGLAPKLPTSERRTATYVP